MKPVTVRVTQLVAALALGVTGLPAPATAATHAYAPGVPLHHHTLPNGLQVLLLPLPTSPVTTMHTWVRAGSRDERPGITGIAHLFEHMMFRPVKPGARSYFEVASALGLDYNASTRFNSTDYYATFKPAALEKVVALDAERFKHLRATDELLKIEREAVRSEYSTKLDANPVVDLWFQIYRRAFPGHPYGWHIVGEREDLDRITAADCNRFFQTNYTPNNTMIVVAGPIEPRATLALIGRHWGDWRRGPGKPAWTNEPKRGTAPVFAHGKLKAPTKYVLMGWRIPERTKADRLAHDLADFILLNERNSLAARRLIDEKHLASEADAFNTDYDIGLSKLFVVPNAKVAPETIVNEVQAAIDGFDQLPDADFQAYREYFGVFHRERQLKTQEVTKALGRAWAYDGDFRNAFTDPRAALGVTRAAVSQVVKTTYRPTNRVTVVTP